MKKIALSILFLSQNIFVDIIKSIVGTSNCCRFEVTCSEYFRISIRKYGIIKGFAVSLERLFKCQPFVSYGRNI